MAFRSGAGVALVAVALLGFTVATPQDASLGYSVDIKEVFDPRGANQAGLEGVDVDDEDLGKLLDRIDGAGLDPDLVDNLDPAALAALLDGLTDAELAALGLTPDEAQDYLERLRDPSLSEEDLADIARELSDRGLRFANEDADGRFDAGEAAYADLDGDGKISEGDLKLGVLALLLGIDRGLGEVNRNRFLQYELAGGLGLTRPTSAASRSTATAATAPIFADGYPTDRAMGPASVVCVQLYSPSLTCHNRTFVHGEVDDRGYTLFKLDEVTLSSATQLVPEPEAPGVRSSAHLQFEPGPAAFYPMPGLTPSDRLVAIDVDSDEFRVYRDGNDMLWMSLGKHSTPFHVNVTWAVDLSYYDLPVAADVTPADVPAALRPKLDATTTAVGQHLAELAGAQGRPYGDAVRALATYVRGFGLGPLPDRDEQPNDLMAIAEAQVGCARHRAEVFTAAAQALGIPARLVVNEAHAFSEVYVPKAGWHLVDVGTCGRVQVRASDGHDEIMALQDLPYAEGDRPPSQADREAAPATVYINITDSPSSTRPNQPFTIGGVIESPDGPIPSGIPITFTYNQTKLDPGTPFCSAVSEGRRFAGSCRLPSGMPPAPNGGSWQLVARLSPSVIGGSPSPEAYSDPPLVVQKATTLTLLGHARTSADVPVAYTAHVVTEDGSPVPQRMVTLRVDGGPAITRATDTSGRARFPLELAPGDHTLSAALAGDDTYDPSEDTLAVHATATRIEVTVDPARLDRGTLTVQGTVTEGSSPAAGRTLTASWANDPDGAAQARSVKTDAQGRFAVTFDGTPRPGPGLASLVDGKTGVGVDAVFMRAVDATATLTVPPRWALGSAVPVEVRVAGPRDPVPLRVTLDGLVVADVEAGDQLPAKVLLTIPLGVHTVGLQAGQGVRLAADDETLLVSPVEARLGSVPVQAPGNTLTVAGTLRFDGQGLAGPVRLRLLGAAGEAVSAGNGAFTVSLVVPADAAPGNATAILELPDVGHQVEVPLRIQRPANLVLEAPGVSFQAFGSTRVTVRGEGNVSVYADGELVGGAGRLDLATRTLLWRKVALRAEAAPADGDLAPTTRTASIHVFNPVMLAGVPMGTVLLGVGATKWIRWLRARIAFRNRFLPPPPRSPIRILEPPLPRRVPRVFDPEVDRTLLLRMPRAGDWRVTVAGRAVPAEVQGRLVRLPLGRFPPGAYDLRFTLARKDLRLRIEVKDLRSALDEATLRLLDRVGRPHPWPATLQAMEEALKAAGATAPDAVAVRREAEDSLYTMDRFGRDRFHAFFATLDDAQARRPA